MSLTNFFLYLLTWTLVALSPGPAAMCVMSQATRHGVRASFSGISGIQTGNVLFFLCIAFGLASVLATATMAFTVLRWIGAVYLFYLGLRIVIGTFHALKAAHETQQPAEASRGLFLQGLLIQLTNPKALLFVSALLPQFIEPQRPFVLQIAILLIVTVAVDVLVMWGYALLAAHGSRSLKGSTFVTWIERAFGAAMMFFGLRLAMAEK